MRLLSVKALSYLYLLVYHLFIKITTEKRKRSALPELLRKKILTIYAKGCKLTVLSEQVDS